MNIKEILKKNEIEIHFKRIFGVNEIYILSKNFIGTEKEFYKMLEKKIFDFSEKRNRKINEENKKIVELNKMVKKLKIRRKKNGISKKRI